MAEKYRDRKKTDYRSKFVRDVKARLHSDIEFNQSMLRVFSPILFMAYAYIVSDFDFRNLHEKIEYSYMATAFYSCSAIVLATLTYIFPGKFLSRRIFAIFLDCGIETYLLAMGDERMLPAFAIMVFTTLGHGIRFGQKYLMLAVALSLLGLFFVTAGNPYWQNQPFIPVTLMLTIIVVPAYASILLTKLHNAVDEAENADRDKSRFLARASHDLRQPIHAIGLLTARLQNSRMSETQTKLIDKIERSVRSASQLFQSILDLSVIESGDLRPKFRPVLISELFSDIEKQHSDAAHQLGMRLRVFNSQKVVFADRMLLMTMLQNLISNAIKYAPNGDILLGCRLKGGRIYIYVCDQGQGLGQNEINYISEASYRMSDSSEGSGLGLAIVTQLAELMKLEIDIKSENGKGTVFTIGRFELSNLPIAPPKPISNLQPKQLRNMRILLIDDDLDSLRATETLLQQWGCTVDAQENFPNVSGPCDVILSDFDFGDGRTLADYRKEIQEMKRKGTATIAISGHSLKSVHDAMKLPDLFVLTKPVRPAQLRSLLMSCKAKD